MTTASVVPSVEELRDYLARRKPLGWDWHVDTLRPLNVRPGANHWSFAVVADDHAALDHEIALRTINPEGNAVKSGWLTLKQEYALLRHLNQCVPVAPKTYCFDGRGFRLPLLFQELIAGSSLASLRERGELSAVHVLAVVELIARTNACPLPAWKFPRLRLRRERTYRQHVKKCRARLGEIAEATTRVPLEHREELAQWYDKLYAAVQPVAERLDYCAAPLLHASPVLIFKGAHLGNTIFEPAGYCCRFIDWESVSWGDPAFTLARFISALHDGEGGVPGITMERMVQAFERSAKQTFLFRQLVKARLLERALSDAVWVVWQYVVRQGKAGSVSAETSIVRRFAHLHQLREGFWS